MLNSDKINQMIEDIMGMLPEGVKNIPSDLQQHLKAALNQTLTKMDVVTREEFDIQVKVLAKTREKIEALEQQLADLSSSDSKTDQADS